MTTVQYLREPDVEQEIRRPRVLVVDDDPAIRLLYAINLELAGFEVLAAEDGQRGLESAVNELPDLVLLDIGMPRLDGFGLAEQLQRDSRTRPIPFIFVSGESAPMSRARAQLLGALDYVTKPFDPHALVSLVTGALAGNGAPGH